MELLGTSHFMAFISTWNNLDRRPDLFGSIQTFLFNRRDVIKIGSTATRPMDGTFHLPSHKFDWIYFEKNWIGQSVSI